MPADQVIRGSFVAVVLGTVLLMSAETSREHAELCRRQNRHRDALMHLNRGHRLFSQIGAKREVADIEPPRGAHNADGV